MQTCVICGQEASDEAWDTYHVSIAGDSIRLHRGCLKDAIESAVTRHYWEMKVLRGEIRAIP